MPSYYLINLFAGYKVEFKKTALLLNGSITNLLNSVYIADARNNKNNNQDFDAKSATVMFGQGFRFNVSIGLQF
jgi:outer membrane receptor protein involved in Fe transport